MRKLIVVTTLVLLAACGRGQDAAPVPVDVATPVVYSVNYPLAWMALALAGDSAEVVFPAPRDVDPAFWQPDVDTLLRFQQADLVLLNGAGYARWVAKASLPASRLVDTARSYADELIVVDEGPMHSHGPKGEHSHGTLAFTSWLDLTLAQQQADTVAGALQALLPARSSVIQESLRELQDKLAQWDAQLLELGRQLAAQPILYSHPVYQYLQRRYGLNGHALHWEPDQEPDAGQWQALAKLLQTHPARLMLWEAAPLPQVASRLEQMGVSVVVFAPMGNQPVQGDFETGMSANIAGLRGAVEALSASEAIASVADRQARRRSASGWK